jgi:hypothetical protein
MKNMNVCTRGLRKLNCGTGAQYAGDRIMARGRCSHVDKAALSCSDDHENDDDDDDDVDLS